MQQKKTLSSLFILAGIVLLIGSAWNPSFTEAVVPSLGNIGGSFNPYGGASTNASSGFSKTLPSSGCRTCSGTIVKVDPTPFGGVSTPLATKFSGSTNSLSSSGSGSSGSGGGSSSSSSGGSSSSSGGGGGVCSGPGDPCGTSGGSGRGDTSRQSISSSGGPSKITITYCYDGFVNSRACRTSGKVCTPVCPSGTQITADGQCSSCVSTGKGSPAQCTPVQPIVCPAGTTFNGSRCAAASCSAVAGSAPTIAISAAPSIVRYLGSARISWDGGNADSCSVSGTGLSATGVTGGEIVTDIAEDRTYTLTCNSGSYSSTANTTVRIVPVWREF